MTSMSQPAEPDIDDPPRLSVGDPVLGKTRLLADECATCIFKPGNLMHLQPGRLKRLVAEAQGEAGYIICHSTLPYAGSPVPPAICRGFADRYTTWQLQLIERLWGFVEVEPPAPADPGDPSTSPDMPHPRRTNATRGAGTGTGTGTAQGDNPHA